MVDPVGESHEVKGCLHPFPALGPGERLQEEWQFDVFISGENRDEMIKLEDVSDV